MQANSPSGLQLTLTQHLSTEGLRYQLLAISLTRPDRLLFPEDLSHLQLPAGIDPTQGVVISGRGPLWLYGHLIHELHPTAWVACYDPRLGAVVVASHSPRVRVGQVILLEKKLVLSNLGPLCSALMIVGPPDSGKSIFAHALFKSLTPEYPNVYLQRAHWDGEGNWILDPENRLTATEREVFKQSYRGELTPEFFLYHHQAILNLRRQKQLVIVDVGGKIQPEKIPLLEACTHYLVISSKTDEVQLWHEFCGARGNLRPLAVINSLSGGIDHVHQWEPYLELQINLQTLTREGLVPKSILERVKQLVVNFTLPMS